MPENNPILLRLSTPDGEASEIDESKGILGRLSDAPEPRPDLKVNGDDGRELSVGDLSINPGKEARLANAEFIDRGVAPQEIASPEGANKIFKDRFIRDNQRENIPLDIESGLPATIRGRLAFRRTKEDKQNFLKAEGFGFRDATDGSLIVQTLDPETGDEKDVLVDETGLTGKDIADLSRIGAELTAGTGAAFIGGGPITTALSFALGESAAGNVIDRVVRKNDLERDGQPEPDIDESEININSLFQFGVSSTFGIVPFVGIRAAKALAGPFAHNVTKLQTQAIDTVKKIEDITGIKIPLTAADETGSPLLARVETLASRVPGGGAVREVKRAQQEALTEAQGKFLNTGEAIDEFDLASEITDAVQQRRNAILGDIGQFKTTARQQAQGNISQAVTDETQLGEIILKSQAGKKAREGAFARRDAINEDLSIKRGTLDEEISKLPPEEQAFVSTQGLNKQFKAILRELPPAGKRTPAQADTITEMEGILELAAQEGNAAAGGRGFPIAAGLVEGLPEKITFTQAQSLRNALFRLTDSDSPVIGTLGGRRIKLLGSELTEAIKNGARNTSNPEVIRALNVFNEASIAKRDTLQGIGVRKLFFDESSPGFIRDEKIPDLILEGRGNVTVFRNLKKFLGEDSVEFRAIKKAALTDIIDSSSTIDGKFINASEFVSRMRNIDFELKEELFGKPFAQAMEKNSSLLKIIEGDKIAPEALTDLITPGTKNVIDEIQKIITSQRIFDRTFNSNLLKNIHNPQSFTNAREITNRFIKTATPKQIDDFMSSVRTSNPKLADDVQRFTIQDILSRARRPGKGELATGVDKADNFIVDLDPKKLEKLLTDNRKRLESALGPERAARLEEFMMLDAAVSQTSALGGQSGSLAVAGFVLSLLKGLGADKLLDVVKIKLASSLLNTAGFRKFAGGKFNPRDLTRSERVSLVASANAIPGLAAEFGENTAMFRAMMSLLSQPSEEEEPEAEKEEGNGTLIDVL